MWRKIVSSVEAKSFAKWQREVNNVKTIVKKDDSIYAVYISSKPFETKGEAIKYLLKLG